MTIEKLGTLFYTLEVRADLASAKSANQQVRAAALGGGGPGVGAAGSTRSMTGAGLGDPFSGHGTFTPGPMGALAGSVRSASGVAATQMYSSPIGPPIAPGPGLGSFANFGAMRSAASQTPWQQARSFLSTPVAPSGLAMSAIFGGWEVAGAHNAASTAQRFAAVHGNDLLGQSAQWNKALDRIAGGPLGASVGALSGMSAKRERIDAILSSARVGDEQARMRIGSQEFTTGLQQQSHIASAATAFERASREVSVAFDKAIREAQKIRDDRVQLDARQVEGYRAGLESTRRERFDEAVKANPRAFSHNATMIGGTPSFGAEYLERSLEEIRRSDDVSANSLANELKIKRNNSHNAMVDAALGLHDAQQSSLNRGHLADYRAGSSAMLFGQAAGARGYVTLNDMAQHNSRLIAGHISQHGVAGSLTYAAGLNSQYAMAAGAVRTGYSQSAEADRAAGKVMQHAARQDTLGSQLAAVDAQFLPQKIGDKVVNFGTLDQTGKGSKDWHFALLEKKDLYEKAQQNVRTNFTQARMRNEAMFGEEITAATMRARGADYFGAAGAMDVYNAASQSSRQFLDKGDRQSAKSSLELGRQNLLAYQAARLGSFTPQEVNPTGTAFGAGTRDPQVEETNRLLKEISDRIARL